MNQEPETFVIIDEETGQRFRAREVGALGEAEWPDNHHWKEMNYEEWNPIAGTWWSGVPRSGQTRGMDPRYPPEYGWAYKRVYVLEPEKDDV